MSAAGYIKTGNHRRAGSNLLRPLARGAFGPGGFTLLETVIAIALLAVGVLTAVTLLTGSLAIMRRTEESLYVTRVLETAVEMTRNLSFTDIDGTGGYASQSPVAFTATSTLLLGANGEILYSKGVPESTDPKVSVALKSATGKVYFQKVNSELYKVTAALTYTPFRRPVRTESVTTYIARKGINRR